MAEYAVCPHCHNPLSQNEWVRVVRCRDCKHYTEDEAEYYHYCGSWCEQVEPDGFCKWGEPKEDA